MKIQLIKSISILAVTFSFFSCNVTDLVPEDAITDYNYWTKPDDMKLFANNFYTMLSGPSSSLDANTDNGVQNTPDSRLFNTMTVPASGGGWSKDDWNTIRNANYFLSHYQTVTGNADIINQYVGEVRFFRAYSYFEKVKTFGDVPWIDKNLTTTDADYLMKARDSQKIVIDKIIEDLEFATENLKEPSNVETGRLHKYAALQMLARVCLYEGTWLKYRKQQGWEAYLQKAVSASEKIMQSGKYDIVKGEALYMYGGYPLYYRQQFIQEDLTNNKECVLARIYKQDLLMHGLSRTTNESGWGISKDFIEDFLCTDGKPIALSPLYEGDDSLEIEIKNRDPRLRNMVENKNLPYYLEGAKLISYKVAPISIDVCPTGYLAFKYRNPEPAQNEALHSTYDWYIFRYAEVLLIDAEAKAELGSITQADIDATINKLRARLDEPGKFTMGRLTLNPPTDPLATINGQPKYGYTISPLIYEIRRERRIELAFEGFRWNDICRWNAGKLIENPKTMLGMVVNNDVVNRYKYYNSGTDLFATRTFYSIQDWDGKSKKLLSVYSNPSRKWDDKLYLNPLPTDQLTLNTHLVQNPGW